MLDELIGHLETAERALKTIAKEHQALEEASTKLANEVAGCWSAYDLELRGVMRHTNFNCVAERLAALRAVLPGSRTE